MKTILCFGDSNTWGAKPVKRYEVLERYSYDERWTTILAKELGAGYQVIAEGNPARTTLWDDPIEGFKNGKAYLGPCLESHQPLDLVIIMLGTNDLKVRFSLSAQDIANSAGVLVDMVQRWKPAVGQAPQVLLIAPPPLGPLPSFWVDLFTGAHEKSRQFSRRYQEVVGYLGCEFLDAAEIVTPSEIDGIHYSAADHERFGKAVAQKVRGILRAHG